MKKITNVKDNQVEKIELLEEFKNKLINYLKYEESNLNGYKILYDLMDIEELLESAFLVAIIDESEFLYNDEEYILDNIFVEELIREFDLEELNLRYVNEQYGELEGMKSQLKQRFERQIS